MRRLHLLRGAVWTVLAWAALFLVVYVATAAASDVYEAAGRSVPFTGTYLGIVTITLGAAPPPDGVAADASISRLAGFTVSVVPFVLGSAPWRARRPARPGRPVAGW